jgi:Zn-dependent protease
MKSNKKSKLVELFLTISSLAAVAAINYAIVHNTFIFVILLVLLAHELGHYFTARQHRVSARLPVFLPLPFLIIAATKVARTNRNLTRSIAFSGPLAGCVTVLFLLIFASLLGFSFNIIMSLLGLLAAEVVFNFFGSDGKRFRSA